MPLRKTPSQILAEQRATGAAPAPSAPANDADESVFDALGGWAGTAAAGVRGLSGLAAAGGPVGAVAGGGGEILAQLIEAMGGIGNDQSLGQRAARVGTEATLGMIPFQKVVKSGQALRNIVRAGGLSAGGDIARQAAEQGTFNPDVDLGRTAFAGTIGGVTGAGAQKLLDKLGMSQPSATPKNDGPLEIVNYGTNDIKGKKIGQGPDRYAIEGSGSGYQGGIRRPAGPVPPAAGQPRRRIGNLADDFAAILAREEAEAAPGDASEFANILGGPSSFADEIGALQSPKSAARAAKASSREEQINREIGAAVTERWLKEEQDQIAAEAAAAFKETAQEIPPTVTETLRREIPGGSESVVRRWVQPEEAEEAGEAVRELNRRPVGNMFSASDAPPAAPAPPTGAQAEADNLLRRIRRMAMRDAGEVAENRVTADRINRPRTAPQAAPQVEELPPQPLGPLSRLLLNRGDAAEDRVIAGRMIPRTVARETAAPPAIVEPVTQVLPTQAVLPIDPAPAPAPAPRVRKPREAKPFQKGWPGEEQIARQSSPFSEDAEGFVAEPDDIEDIRRQLVSMLEGSPGKPKGFFTNRVDPTGEAYRAAKADADTPKEGVRLLGKLLQREAKAAGLPTGKGAKGALNPKGEKGFSQTELISTLASTLLGGATGAAVGAEDDNALAGAAIGATAGFGLPMAARALMRTPDTGGIGEALSKATENPNVSRSSLMDLLEKLPNAQRSNLLMSSEGLAANALAGPYGSATMGTLESALSGDPRGAAALKNVVNPMRFFRDIQDNWGEAATRVREGELGRADFSATSNPNVVEQIMSFPAVAMTSGDLSRMKALIAAGYTEPEARTMVLTSEPVSRLGHGIVNLGRGTPTGNADRLSKVAANLMLPFRRTPVNILEQGLPRLPVVGALGRLALEDDALANWRNIAAQQAISGAVTGGSYALGSQLNPEEARTARRFVSNLGGQYSLPASIGFAVGQGKARKTKGEQIVKNALNDSIPLPTTDALADIAALLTTGKAPRGLVPAEVREVMRPREKTPRAQKRRRSSVEEIRRRRSQ